MTAQTRQPVVAASIIALLTVAGLRADNWPQWRGPSLNGVSTERNLPTRWDTKSNITWKLRLPGLSAATPIVWDQYIFLNVADHDTLSLWAVDRAKGTMAWQRMLGGGNRRERKHNMSSPSPVTDGSRVWVATGTGRVVAFDFTGRELWNRDLQKEYGRFGMGYGYASSPLLHDGSVYLEVLHGSYTREPSYVMKLDGTTGKTIWRILRPTRAIQESLDAYTTPVVVQHGPNEELIVVGGDVITAYNTASGRELWRAEGLNPYNSGNYRIVASPVVFGDMVYTASRGRPLIAFKTGGTGDVTRTHRVWSTDNGPDVPTPVTDGTYLYVVRDNGVLWCLDALTGARIYGPQRLRPATYSSSPVLADGKLYVTNEDGLTSVIKAGPQFQLIAENDLNDFALSSPAISDGQVFIRTGDFLWAIGRRVIATPTP
jgi:hypothetical protein